jgi:anti-sigma B factor antagonist
MRTRRRLAQTARTRMMPPGMALLEVTAHERGDATVIALAGELDISSAGRVEQELARAEARQPSVVVLDLSGLAFMDSTGLRIVVGADARARERGGRLTVVRGPEPVHRVFRITRLDERLTMADSADEAGAAAA